MRQTNIGCPTLELLLTLELLHKISYLRDRLIHLVYFKRFLATRQEIGQNSLFSKETTIRQLTF